MLWGYLWLLRRQQVYDVTEGDLLEIERVELVQEQLCLIVCDADVHAFEESCELAVVDDAVVVRVLLLEEL